MQALLYIATTTLTTIVLCTALTHVLEWAGKNRLDRRAYSATQTIYYPGFTIAGFAEVLAIPTIAGLLIYSRNDGFLVKCNATALAALTLLHATYWMMIHPVNKFWMKDQNLVGLSRGFFAFGRPASKIDDDAEAIWRSYRDRWELSHAIRAGFATVAFFSLLLALAHRQ